MSKQTNVLLVGNYGPNTGYAWWLMENFWLQINELVQQKGGDCLLAYPKSGTPPKNIDKSNIEPIVHDWSDRSWENLMKLRNLIRTRQISTVYLTDRAYLDWLYALLRVWGVRNIILHDHIPGERPTVPVWKLSLKMFAHRLYVFSCDLYIGVSDFVRQRFIKVAGVPEERTCYVHNGVAAAQDANPALKVRRATGAKQRSVMIVSVGRAHRYKGIEFMIDVASRVEAASSHDVRFLHVGEGPHLEEFKEKAQEMELEDRFHFAGHRDDVFSILLASDIAFHASRGEAFSLAVLEYMAAGLPVVLPEHCGNPEAVDHGREGFLYEPRNDSQAANYLDRLIQNVSQRKRLGENAKQKWSRKFQLEDCNKRFRAAIKSTVFD